MGIKESISELRQKFDADLSEVRDSESIEKLRVSYLGKKGSVTELLKGLKDLSGAEKKEFGQTINTLKREVDERITAHVERRKTAVSTAQSNMMSRCRWIPTAAPITPSRSCSASWKKFSLPWALRLKTTARS